MKLTLEGRPGDAGRLLTVLGAATSEPEVASIGGLLTSFPVFDSAAEEAGGAYVTAWEGWKARAVAARNAGTGRGLHPCAEALTSLLAGDVASALARLRYTGNLVPQRSDFSSDTDDDRQAALYAGAWFYHALPSLLYSPPGGGPPPALRRRGFYAFLRQCMSAAGERLVDGNVAGSAGAVAASDVTIDPMTDLTSGLLSIYRGDVGWALNALHCWGHPWASAHLCDLLWSRGLMHSPVALWPGPWAAPLRAHLLLQHAVTLATPTAIITVEGGSAQSNSDISASSQWRSALTYAAAATPEAVRAEATTATSPAVTSDPSQALLCVHTGSAPSAHTLLRLLTERAAPSLTSAADVTSVSALAGGQLGLSDVACGLRARWAQQCLAVEGDSEACEGKAQQSQEGLGTALAAILDAVGHCACAVNSNISSNSGSDLIEGRDGRIVVARVCRQLGPSLDAVGRSLATATWAAVPSSYGASPAADDDSAYASALDFLAVDAAYAAVEATFDAAVDQSEVPPALTTACSLSPPLRYAVTLRRYFAALAATPSDANKATAAGLLEDMLLQQQPMVGSSHETAPLCPPSDVPRLVHAALRHDVLEGAHPQLLRLALSRLRECDTDAQCAPSLLGRLCAEVTRCLAAVDVGAVQGEWTAGTVWR